MDQLHDIRNAVDAVLGIMAEREYAASTIKTHRGILNSLIKFMEKNQLHKIGGTCWPLLHQRKNWCGDGWILG